MDAVEPDPLNRERLEANLTSNGAPAHVKVHATAVSDAGRATDGHNCPSVAKHLRPGRVVGL